MDRLFLDSNVLFSAAYSEATCVGELWKLPDVEMVTSAYAVQEARRNLLATRSAAVPRLEQMLAPVAVLTDTEDRALPESAGLPDKDRPILQAAVEAGASHLITGDKRHFRDLFGKTIRGVVIATPTKYLTSRQA